MDIITVGGRQCVHGFDWSQWQPPREHDGKSVGLIKVSEGNGWRDPSFALHWASLHLAPCKGTYDFARPNGPDPYQDGRSEAAYQIANTPSTAAFIVCDLEASSVDAHGTTQFTRGWLDQVEASGRWPRREQRVMYVGKWFTWEHALDVSRRCVLMIPSYTAGYTPNPDPTRIPLPAWSTDLWPEGWHLWQYTSSGTEAGVHPSDRFVATLQWYQAVMGQILTPPEPFITPEKIHMAQPVFETQAGGHYYAADAPDAPKGIGWRWIDGPEEETRLALVGKVEPARVCKIGVGDGKPIGHRLDPDAIDVYDEAWNSYPVLNGPEARP